MKKIIIEMPCEPGELRFDRYILPSSLEPAPERKKREIPEDGIQFSMSVSMKDGNQVSFEQLSVLDEAAARLLIFSVEAGFFREVSWMEICQRLVEELDIPRGASAPFSIYRITGKDGFTDGFTELVTKGYAEARKAGKKHAGWLMRPTQKLVSAVFEMNAARDQTGTGNNAVR